MLSYYFTMKVRRVIKATRTRESTKTGKVEKSRQSK
jgi:hypothetical protein